MCQGQQYNCVSIGVINILHSARRLGENLKIFQPRLQIFNRVRSENAQALEKLCQVAGDVLKPTLGLSDVDLHILLQEVSVVIHTAATVRFNECISLAVEMNTLGTRRVIELCKQLPLLQVKCSFFWVYGN
jgi:alcohol-forming fatty acyl-CoA reductase